MCAITNIKGKRKYPSSVVGKYLSNVPSVILWWVFAVWWISLNEMHVHGIQVVTYTLHSIPETSRSECYLLLRNVSLKCNCAARAHSEINTK